MPIGSDNLAVLDQLTPQRPSSPPPVADAPLPEQNSSGTPDFDTPRTVTQVTTKPFVPTPPTPRQPPAPEENEACAVEGEGLASLDIPGLLAALRSIDENPSSNVAWAYNGKVYNIAKRLNLNNVPTRSDDPKAARRQVIQKRYDAMRAAGIDGLIAKFADLWALRNRGRKMDGVSWCETLVDNLIQCYPHLLVAINTMGVSKLYDIFAGLRQLDRDITYVSNRNIVLASVDPIYGPLLETILRLCPQSMPKVTYLVEFFIDMFSDRACGIQLLRSAARNDLVQAFTTWVPPFEINEEAASAPASK